jgi:hypothetical protein
VNDNTPDRPRAEGAAGAGRCPICAKPAAPASRPFCSARCADVDLHRWLSGAYAMPAAADEGRPEDERA